MPTPACSFAMPCEKETAPQAVPTTEVPPPAPPASVQSVRGFSYTCILKVFCLLNASIKFGRIFPVPANKKKPLPSSTRRSSCAVAAALDLLGDRWTLLVIRDMFLGKSRFKDFVSSPEGIPTNILTDRLERLVNAGMARRIPSSPGSRHLAYELTPKGKSLGPVLRSLRDWGLTWEKGTEAFIRD